MGDGPLLMWEFQLIGTDEWRSFGSSFSNTLEQHYGEVTHNRTPIVRFNSDGYPHEINIADMSVRLVGSEELWPIRRQMLDGPHWHWFDGQLWIRYDLVISQQIERSFANHFSTHRVNELYTIEFDEGLSFQVNLVSKTRRPVLRIDYSFFEHTPPEVLVSAFTITDVIVSYSARTAPAMPTRRETARPIQHELLVKARNVADMNCPLCLEQLTSKTDPVRLAQCNGHYFHRDCGIGMTITELIIATGRCPVCKLNYTWPPPDASPSSG